MGFEMACFDCLYAIKICAKETVAERACWARVRCVRLARNIHFLLFARMLSCYRRLNAKFVEFTDDGVKR